MSTPIVEYIAANIATAISAITTGNGFNQTLTAVRPTRVDWQDVTPENNMVLIVQEDDSPASETHSPTALWVQTFVLGALVYDSKDAGTALDTRRNQVRSDIRKKLMEDRTRGGYAFNTIITGSANMEDEEGLNIGVIVTVDVHYRILTNDPYTKG